MMGTMEVRYETWQPALCAGHCDDAATVSPHLGREEEDIIKQPWKLTKTMARGLYIGFYYYCEFPLSFSPLVQWTAREN